MTGKRANVSRFHDIYQMLANTGHILGRMRPTYAHSPQFCRARIIWTSGHRIGFRADMVSMDTYFAEVRRHLPSPGNYTDPSKLEGEASEHGALYQLAG